MGKLVKLKDVVGTYVPERGLYNSYNWYREHAKKYGNISIGSVKISVHKEKGSWVLDLAEFDQAVKSFIDKKADQEKHIESMMNDYKKGIFHKGIIWISDTLSYDNKGDFRFEIDEYALARKDSSGRWYCNTCNNLAETEYNNPECHTCSDWGNCGRDCTLSRVYCPQCKKSLEIK